VEELGRAAKSAGIREREKSFTVEAIEGTENLQLLTISANYEGNYADLVQFANQIDRSDRLLIIEALQAQPQQGGQGQSQGLAIQVKLSAILRDDGSVGPAPAAHKEVARR
jgi:Tfp pilus assembly protein PilO